MAERQETRAATITIFRRWYNGDVIALFPALAADVGGLYCTSYERIGQHGAADYAGVVARTRPATVAQTRDLRLELERVGYTLDVRARYQRPRVKG